MLYNTKVLYHEIVDECETQPIYNLDDFPVELKRFNFGAYLFPIAFCREMKIPLDIYRNFRFFQDIDLSTNKRIQEGKLKDKELSTYDFGIFANKLAWQYRFNPDQKSIFDNLSNWNRLGKVTNILFSIFIVLMFALIFCFGVIGQPSN